MARPPSPSPALPCASPRPLPELPSLSFSLSTAPSTARAPSPSSPIHDIISFPSPASSQFHLCEFPSSPARPPADASTPSLPSPARSSSPPHSPRLRPPKKPFILRVRHLGARLKSLLRRSPIDDPADHEDKQSRRPPEPRGSATRGDDVPHKRARALTVTIPAHVSLDPGLQSAPADASALPTASSPTLSKNTRRPASSRADRRFSLPSLFLARNPPPVSAVGIKGSSAANTPTDSLSPFQAAEPRLEHIYAGVYATPNAAAPTLPLPDVFVRTESQRAVDRMLEDWADNGNDGSRIEAEQVVKGLGIDLTQRSRRAVEKERAESNSP